MECLYYHDFEETDNFCSMRDDSLNHIKALHLKISEQTLITNGRGATALAELSTFNKKLAVFNIIETYKYLNENNYKTALAIGILDNRDRFEYAIEKAVELGVNSVYPLICSYSQKKSINPERLKQKAISALIQSKRSVLPAINEPIMLTEIQNISEGYDNVILCEESAVNKPILLKGNNLILIGPEGGFSTEELEWIHCLPKINEMNLGSRRLRSETATICALNLNNYFNNKD